MLNRIRNNNTSTCITITGLDIFHLTNYNMIGSKNFKFSQQNRIVGSTTLTIKFSSWTLAVSGRPPTGRDVINFPSSSPRRTVRSCKSPWKPWACKYSWHLRNIYHIHIASAVILYKGKECDISVNGMDITFMTWDAQLLYILRFSRFKIVS